jgi:hypothetical protein
MPKKTYNIRLDVKSLSRLSGMILFILGVLALIISIIYTSSTLAFVGLGIVFWGAILTYIRSDEYVQGSLLNATATPALSTLNQTLGELGYNGKPVYLPPKYLNNPDENKVYIPKLKNSKLPTPEQTQKLESQNPSSDSQGIILTPPGSELTKLFEKTLGTTFTRTDLDHLMQNMPKLIIEDLEIATNLEITAGTRNPEEPTKSTASQAGPGRIHVTITDSIYKEMYKEIEQMANIHGNLGCPLTSAIACAIAKATGKPTIIEDEKTMEDGQTKEADYYTYEEA